MNKKIAVTVFVFLSIIGFSTANAKELKIAIGEWAPFISVDLPGFGPHAQMVSKVLMEMGYDPIYVFQPWVRSFHATSAGQYLATFSWQYTQERARQLLYSRNPIDTSHSVVFYRKDRFPDGVNVTQLEDLVEQKLSIAGVRSYWYVPELERLAAELYLSSDAEPTWRLLDKGRVDVVIGNLEAGLNDIKSFFGEDKVDSFAHSKPISDREVYVLFTDSPEGAIMRKLFDTTFDRLRAEGRL